MSILKYIFGGHLSSRSQLIDEFNREINREQRDADSLYIAGRNLITAYPNDFGTRDVYRLGIRSITKKESLTAMQLCCLPLTWNLKSGCYFKEGLVALLLITCQERVNDSSAEPKDLEDAIAYLDEAAMNYSEYPDLANNALNMAIDLINGLGLHSPEKAASIVAQRFPNETYMFADSICHQLKVMPKLA